MYNIIQQGGLLELFPQVIRIAFLGFLALKGFDFFTGILKVWKNGGYQSSKMRDGFIRFTAELICVAFVITMDFIMGLEFYLTGMTLSYMLYKESGSILENLGELGVYIPKQIADKIEVLNPKDKEEK